MSDSKESPLFLNTFNCIFSKMLIETESYSIINISKLCSKNKHIDVKILEKKRNLQLMEFLLKYSKAVVHPFSYQGVSQLWVRVRALTPSLWKVLRTPRLVPMEWPDSTVITLAILPFL